MADDLTKNPLIIDTADAVNAKIAAGNRLRIRAIRIVDTDAVAGDRYVVQDANGEEVWEAVANVVNFHDGIDFGGAGGGCGHGGFDAAGLKVPTLAGGKLYVYLL